ncbi:response regulator transcription factor [Rheinheimera texasensis]|uniref:response regulator transcription factor n=1 Tax=Rheinheimera texasensis TaxID=306205 RepID=UPI0004E19A17|nr:response regulator [Rheinheimera texasensis]
MKLTVLDDDEVLLRTLQRRLTAAGHQVRIFATPPALTELIEEPADAWLLDLRYGDVSGLNYVAPLRQYFPDCRILVLTGFASIATAVQAVKLGADDYLTKPVDFAVLLQALQGDKAVPQVIEHNSDDNEALLSTDQIEWEHIQRVLAQQDGNISQTARLLGMHRRTLQRKLLKHRPG